MRHDAQQLRVRAQMDVVLAVVRTDVIPLRRVAHDKVLAQRRHLAELRRRGTIEVEANQPDTSAIEDLALLRVVRWLGRRREMQVQVRGDASSASAPALRNEAK